MTKDDWIAAAAARYVYRGLSEQDAQESAKVLWVDYNGRIIPEYCVDKDIGDCEK
jgi:hypothetical protein